MCGLNWGRSVSWGVAAAAVLIGTQMAAAAPPGYQPLGPQSRSVVIMELMDGETAGAVFDTLIKSDIHEKVSALHLWADVSLAELQDKAQAIVGDKPLTDDCTDTVTITDVTMSIGEPPAESHAELCGTVVYEHRICTKIWVPDYEGTETGYRSAEVERGTLSTESGEICAAVWPEVDSSQQSFVLNYEVTEHELAATLAGLPNPVDVAKMFYGVHLADAFAAVTEAGFPVPEPLQDREVTVLEVVFAEAFEGMLMMQVDALMPVREGEVADIVIQLLTIAAGGETGT